MAAAPEWRPMTRTSSTYIAETARGTHSFKVTMKRGAAAIGACVTSDTFAVGGHDWRIRCYPQGGLSKTHVAVLLDLVGEGGGVEVEVLCDFSLLNRATEAFSSVFSAERPSKPSKGPWGTHWFMKRSLLGASSYLKDGCIVIGCDITVVIRKSLVEETVEVQVPPSDMSDDLGRLLESGVGADVTFEVKGEVFHAHKIVLAARSPVFKDLIYGSMMRDNETMSIRVEDVEPDVFKALLRFIYTDSLPAMDDLDGGKNEEEEVWKLLVAAKKYAVERLRLACVDIVGQRLDDKSVIGNLALADKHHCSEARDACIQFMKRECPAVYIDMWEKAARCGKT